MTGDTNGTSEEQNSNQFDGVDDAVDGAGEVGEALGEHSETIEDAGESLADATGDAPEELRLLAYGYFAGLAALVGVSVLGVLFGAVETSAISTVVEMAFLPETAQTAVAVGVAAFSVVMALVALPGSFIRAFTEIVVDTIS